MYITLDTFIQNFNTCNVVHANGLILFLLILMHLWLTSHKPMIALYYT